MYRYFAHLFSNYFVFLPLMCMSLFSCVYFNTFYNAEVSFKKAIKIIEESPLIDKNELPSQAKKLLGESIDNSKLVIKIYPDSKYVDDAIFIIGRAAFLREESAVAERYFNMLLKQYPDSKYFSESEIWLAYSHFRLGLIDSSKIAIEKKIKNDKINDEELYIIHNLLAEISELDGNIEKVYENYELAAKYSSSESEKTATFSKLVKISEINGDKNQSINYLEELGKVAPDKIRIDSKMKWIVYNRELGNYDQIITEIEMLLGLSEFSSEYIQLELELGKVYMEKGDLAIAKDIFLQMVEVYSKKNETSEAYFQLAKMSLMDAFNIDLAKEYLEKSKKEKSQSKYGKKAKELLNKIDRFEDLESSYKDLAKEYEDKANSLIEEFYIADSSRTEESFHRENDLVLDTLNYMSNNMVVNNIQLETNTGIDLNAIKPDSILFMIGEMLLYDFQHLGLSLDRFKIIADKYPNSKFAPKSLYVLNHFEPSKDWKDILIKNYPNSSFFMTDTLSIDNSQLDFINAKRDYAWSLSRKSYNYAYKEFNKLSNQYEDTLSAYICGFIADYYLNDLDLAIIDYQSFLENFPDHFYAEAANKRLLDIKGSIENAKEVSKQAIDYFIAINYLTNDFKYDSAQVLLREVKRGPSQIYVNASNRAEVAIDTYIELNKKIKDLEKDFNLDSLLSQSSTLNDYEILDSLYFSMAKLFSEDFQITDSAILFYKHIVANFVDSQFRAKSLLYLKEKDSSEVWDEILITDYNNEINSDTILSIEPIYLDEINSNQFINKQENSIQEYDQYLNLFSTSFDSIKSDTMDSTLIPEESTLIDSIILPSIQNKKVDIIK